MGDGATVMGPAEVCEGEERRRREGDGGELEGRGLVLFVVCASVGREGGLSKGEK